MQIVDITDCLIDPEDMPLCPICDQPIMMGDVAAVGTTDGMACLIHEFCCEEGEQ